MDIPGNTYPHTPYIQIFTALNAKKNVAICSHTSDQNFRYREVHQLDMLESGFKLQLASNKGFQIKLLENRRVLFEKVC